MSLKSRNLLKAMKILKKYGEPIVFLDNTKIWITIGKQILAEDQKKIFDLGCRWDNIISEYYLLYDDLTIEKKDDIN